MITLKIDNFSISQIANSGQCFRIDKISSKEKNLWQVIAMDKLLIIETVNEIEYIFHCSPEEYHSIWEIYFDINRDYDKIKQEFIDLKNPYITAAIQHGSGIRILKQDLWEVIVSFIISQRNSIPRIKTCIKNLCQPYGNSFPSAEILSNFSEIDFRKLGLGYRSKYLYDIAKSVTKNEFCCGYLQSLTTSDAIRYLQLFSGIGKKVATCIALYGLHRLEAFPIDTWIGRAILHKLNGDVGPGIKSPHAGILQQYIFFYEKSLLDSRRNIKA